MATADYRDIRVQLADNESPSFRHMLPVLSIGMYMPILCLTVGNRIFKYTKLRLYR